MVHNSKISIILADDHPIMLDGLKQQLEAVGYNVLDTANNGNKAIELILTHRPTIAILDLEMPILSGFDVIKSLSSTANQTRFVAMTYHKSNGFMVQAKQFGFMGYLVKEDGIDEIEKCIASVINDELYYSTSLAPTIKSDIEKELLKIKRLTPSERTIIRLVAQELTSAQIGEQLSITLRTVQNHRSNIISKLDLDKGADVLSQWTKEFKDLVILL